MFGKIKCNQCGTILEGEDALKMSGITFCSESCAQEYKKTSNNSCNCCC